MPVSTLMKALREAGTTDERDDEDLLAGPEGLEAVVMASAEGVEVAGSSPGRMGPVAKRALRWTADLLSAERVRWILGLRRLAAICLRVVILNQG